MKRTTVIAAAVFSLASLASSLQGATRPAPVDRLGPVGDPKPVRTQMFEDRSNGWYWVYEGVAQAQSFVAFGPEIGAIRLRVAHLNDQAPTAPLTIEVRSANLKEVYLRAAIAPEEASRPFQWITARTEHATPLEEGKTYVLLLHSQATHHDGPWVVGAAFRNAFPDGRHLGYPDDLLLSVEFKQRINLVVGPPLTARAEYPLGSGRKGGKPMAGRPALLPAGGTLNPAARLDPLGPVPAGELVVPGVTRAP